MDDAQTTGTIDPQKPGYVASKSKMTQSRMIAVLTA
jgi:hypothetical protein